MDKNVRERLFTPLSGGTLRTIVPNFSIQAMGKKTRAPALLTCDGEEFTFTIHFSKSVPPLGLGMLTKTFLTQADQITVSGEIDGDISFRCRDVFPPAGCITRSRGTSTIQLRSHRMELLAEGDDRLKNRKIRALLKLPKETKRHASFDAHVIFHGPKLRIRDGGSSVTRKNDFLREAVSSSADTHMFSGTGYEGALIQKSGELHLHLRSIDDDVTSSVSPSELVDHVTQSVAFAFGFHPWPVYRELRIDHRIRERGLSPHLDLEQSFLAPVSESLWLTYHDERSNPLYSIIPTIAAGLSQLQESERSRIEKMLWIARSTDLSGMPQSTKVLILCSAFDGLLQLIAGMANDDKFPKTDRLWRKASDKLGLSWDRWTSGIFEIRGKYRNMLAHGRLWIPEERSIEDFGDYARLGCAFMTIIAARCGYEGPVLADPFESRKVVIRDIKVG